MPSLKADMEDKLTRAYRHAYVVNRYKRSPQMVSNNGGDKRYKRSPQMLGNNKGEKRYKRSPQMVNNNDGDKEEWPKVKIHNIRSSLPEPEIEMIYTVSRGKEGKYVTN